MLDGLEHVQHRRQVPRLQPPMDVDLVPAMRRLVAPSGLVPRAGRLADSPPDVRRPPPSATMSRPAQHRTPGAGHDMRSKATLLGHPVHPMLIPFPIAFLTGAVGFDAAGWLGDAPAWWTTGGYLGCAGIVTALLAAVPGFVDYLYTVPPKSSGKERATKHMAA